MISVRAPRAGGRDRAPENYGLDAREFLRKKLIGKEVTVKMEYTRKMGPQVPGADGAAAAAGPDVRCLSGLEGFEGSCRTAVLDAHCAMLGQSLRKCLCNCCSVGTRESIAIDIQVLMTCS
jgi:hypothetical protein